MLKLIKTKKKYPQKEVVEDLKDGDAGVLDQTLPKMAKLAIRDSKEPIVINTAKSLRGKTDFETVENIFNFVWKEFPYKSDPPDAEYVTAPVHLLNGDYEYCDCDDMTTLLVSLLESQGFDTLIKVIAWDKKRCDEFSCPFTHVYLFCFIPSLDGYIPLDAVQKASGFGRESPPTPIIRQEYRKVA